MLHVLLLFYFLSPSYLVDNAYLSSFCHLHQDMLPSGGSNMVKGSEDLLFHIGNSLTTFHIINITQSNTIFYND